MSSFRIKRIYCELKTLIFIYLLFILIFSVLRLYRNNLMVYANYLESLIESFMEHIE